jgi:hypothetical protein
LPVDGQTAFWVVGSNWPVTSRGTRQPNLVRPSGKPLADGSDDPGLDTGQRPRKFDKINAAKTAAVDNGLVVPGDAKQVQGVDIPQTDVFQPGYHGLWNQTGVTLLL